MADLPRYKAQQPITPDPHTRDAIREVQTGADRLQGAFQEFSNKNMQQYQMQQNYAAKQEGEQAGSDLNFKPSQPVTQADMVYQNAALEANKAAVQLDISSNLQRIRDEVMDPKNFGPDAVNRYNKLASAYQEGAFAAIPREVQPSAKHFFEYYNQQNSQVVTHSVQGLTKNQLQYQLFDYLNQTEKDASNASFSGDHDAAAALVGQGVQKLQSAVATGLIGGPTAAHLKEGYVSQAHQEGYLGQFSRILNTDPSKASAFISDFLKSPGVDMTPIERMKLVTTMHRMWRQYELQQDMDGINIRQQMKSAIAGVQNGESPSKYANIVAQVQGFSPKEYPAFAAKMQAAEFSYAVEDALTYATPAEQQAILTASKPHPFLADGVTPNPAYAELIAAWDHASNLVQKLDKQWKDDPAGMAIKNPSVVKAYDDRNQAATGPDGKVQSVTRGTINPLDAMINVELKRGVPPENLSVMTKSMAAGTVSELKGMDLPGQVAKLNSLLPQYGQYAPIASKDLQKAGLEFQPLLAVAVSNNPASRGALPDVMKALSANPKDIEKAMPAGATTKAVHAQVAGAMSDWSAAMLQSSNGDTTQHRAEMTKAVTQYASWLVANGKSDSAGAAQMAADTLINNFYNYSKINGYKVALPKDVDTSMAKDAFNYLLDGAKKSDLQVPGFYASTFHTLTNDQLQSQYKSDSVGQAHLAVLPGDTTAVLVDDQSTPILDKSGKRFEFNFKDLGDSFSPIRTEMAKQKTFLSKVGDVAHYLDPSIFKDDE